MSAGNFGNASGDFRRLNPGLFENGRAQDGADRLTVLAGDERELQAACERWLLLRGYRRRVEGVILEGRPPRGWFVHLHEAAGNPLLLDLLILGNDGRFLEVELKTATGRVQRFQAELVRQGARLCRDLADFAGAVVAWENEPVTKGGHENDIG